MPPATAPFGQIPADIVEVAYGARSLPLAARMEAVSGALLGRPYLADPLGEGQGHDADPFARYDAFDCLTFAEEVLALALAGDPTDAARVRKSLRYGDRAPTYANRRHFMELQWIPGNIADGWLRDTTRSYGETVHLEKEVTAATWSGWSARRKFAITDDELPVGTMALDVLPLDVAEEAADRIRPGSLILTVREDREGIPIWVTHVGFLVTDTPRPTLRHSTKMGDATSRDHPLAWYLEHVRTYRPRKVLGIAILEPVDSGPRVGRAPP